MNVSEFKLDLPYPEVEGEICKECAALLQESYSGRISEATAIFQYAYQSYVLKKDNPKLSALLEQIAIVEMLHHELLAKAIIAFGGNPVISGRSAFFSGSYVNYATNPCAIINNNIIGEQKAICDYQKTIAVCDNCSLKELLNRIIMDEELHISALKNALDEM